MVTSNIYIIERSSKLKNLTYFLAGIWFGIFVANAFNDESRPKE